MHIIYNLGYQKSRRHKQWQIVEVVMLTVYPRVASPDTQLIIMESSRDDDSLFLILSFSS